MASIKSTHINELRRLYYEENLSMHEVSKKLGVSLFAVEYAMRKHGLKRRSSAASNAHNYQKKAASFTRNLPLGESSKLLEVAGLMLYWAEGSKSENWNCVDFANSDPDMVSIFLGFLRNSFTLNESKFRIQMYCYSNQNTDDLKHFWSDLSGIPETQFIKPFVRSDFDPNSKRIMKYGLVHIRYNDKKLLSEILKLIDSYKGICVGGRAVNCTRL